MKKPTISVIIPCYNQAQYLDDALQSVLNQTLSDWECIIVDDGSPDNTKEVAEKWIRKDNRFIYRHKMNGGLASARNVGLNNACGAYIQFLDCDDYLANDKFAKSINEFEKLENKNKYIVISNFKMFTENHEQLTEPFCHLTSAMFNFESILYKWDETFSIPIHCGFFKASLFETFRFPEFLKAKEDWVMWIDVFKNKAQPIFIDLPLAYYRLHPKSMMHTKEMQKDFLNAFMYIRTIVTDDEHLTLAKTLLARFYRLNKENKLRITYLKNSNTFKVGLLIKKLLKNAKILKPAKYIFNQFSKNRVFENSK